MDYSFLCVIACLLLIVLWVRSYSHTLHDVFSMQTSSRVHILDSTRGRLAYCQRYSLLNRTVPRMLDPESMNDEITGIFVTKFRNSDVLINTAGVDHIAQLFSPRIGSRFFPSLH